MTLIKSFHIFHSFDPFSTSSCVHLVPFASICVQREHCGHRTQLHELCWLMWVVAWVTRSSFCSKDILEIVKWKWKAVESSEKKAKWSKLCHQWSTSYLTHGTLKYQICPQFLSVCIHWPWMCCCAAAHGLQKAGSADDYKPGWGAVCVVSVCTLCHPPSSFTTIYMWQLAGGTLVSTELLSDPHSIVKKQRYGSDKWCWNRWDAALCTASSSTGSGRTPFHQSAFNRRLMSYPLQLEDLVEKAKDYALMHGW